MDLKFRAWDKKSLKMRIVCSLGFTTTKYRSTRGVNYAGVLGGDGKRAGINVDIMQWTGFKDKNGVEIYDGDIVRVGGLIEQVQYVDGILICCHYRVNLVTKHEIDEGYIVNESDWFEVYEIIGNIYENPELLIKKE